MPDQPENSDQSRAEASGAPRAMTDDEKQVLKANLTDLVNEMTQGASSKAAQTANEGEAEAEEAETEEGVVDLEDEDGDFNFDSADYGEQDDEVEAAPWAAYAEAAEEADDEDEVEEEATYEEAEPEQSETEAEYDEEQLSEADRALLAERKARLTAEKRLAYAESQALAIKRKNWVERDGKHFPFLRELDLKELAGQVTSRRQFARAARAKNEQVKEIAAPIIQRELQKQKAQRKSDLKAQWGSPVAGPGALSDVQRTNRELDEARAKGDLQGAVKALLFGAKKN